MQFTREECIEAMQTMTADLGSAPTRDRFRKEGGIPQIDWLTHFGTYTEFKKQAQVEFSSSENRLFSKIAEQNDVIKMRELGQQRKEWSGLYLNHKPNQRFYKLLVGSDIHDEMCDPFYRRMFIKTAGAIQPDKIVLNGDLFDLAEISSYSKRANEYNPVSKMKWVHEFLADLRTASPNTEIHLVEGNHEYRLIAHLTEKSPYVMDILNFNGVGVKDFLGLTQFGVNYHARADFASFTEADIRDQLKRNYYKFNDFFLCHHFPLGARFGMPGVSGHHHKYEVKPHFNATYGSYQWICSGGGSRRHVDYQEPMGEMWNNGFVVAVVDTENKRNTIMNYIDCTGEFCLLNGKLYKRTEEEMKFCF